MHLRWSLRYLGELERDIDVNKGELLVCIVFMLLQLSCTTSYILKVGIEERVGEIGVVERCRLLVQGDYNANSYNSNIGRGRLDGWDDNELDKGEQSRGRRSRANVLVVRAESWMGGNRSDKVDLGVL